MAPAVVRPSHLESVAASGGMTKKPSAVVIVSMLLTACGGTEHNTNLDPDSGVGSGSGSSSGSGSGYTMTTRTGSCETLVSPQALPLGGLTHVTDIFDLPHAVPFWDETAGRIAVAEQGQLFLFPATGSTSITTLVDPVAIPSPMAPNGFVAPLWMFHLSFVPSRSEIDASRSSDHITIQWMDFAIGTVNADQASHVTMQVRLFDAGSIELDYCRLEPGSQPTTTISGDHAVIGIESPDGTRGVQAGAFTAGTATIATGYTFTRISPPAGRPT
jgi:hypothetical protein